MLNDQVANLGVRACDRRCVYCHEFLFYFLLGIFNFFLVKNFYFLV